MFTDFGLAKIDKLKKSWASQVKDTNMEEIKRPDGPLTHLQHAMGLEHDKQLYMTYRASFKITIFLENANIAIGNC